MLQKEVIEVGEKIASDLMDAQVSKNMGSMGGHIIKDISKYDNSDLIQKYIDGEIVSVEAIYTAMKRVKENGSSYNTVTRDGEVVVIDNPPVSLRLSVSEAAALRDRIEAAIMDYDARQEGNGEQGTANTQQSPCSNCWKQITACKLGYKIENKPCARQEPRTEIIGRVGREKNETKS